MNRFLFWYATLCITGNVHVSVTLYMHKQGYCYCQHKCWLHFQQAQYKPTNLFLENEYGVCQTMPLAPWFAVALQATTWRPPFCVPLRSSWRVISLQSPHLHCQCYSIRDFGEIDDVQCMSIAVDAHTQRNPPKKLNTCKISYKRAKINVCCCTFAWMSLLLCLWR